MKIVAIFLTFFFILGSVMYIQLEMEHDDTTEVREFIESRGKTPIPKSWRKEIGKGI